MPDSEDPTLDSPSPPSTGAPPLAKPETIGPYRVLDILGEGGFGTVYVAEQTHPVRRRVALKVIKAGMDTRAVLARFDAERQALALMDHPSIARVLDAGATDNARPYFVMELVKGEPINSYCNRNALDTTERINLLIQVASAVQHAHQKGVIHRDLKPSNILVSVTDDGPLPKVIDFGIAKATASQLTEQTIYTREGQLIGTPEYMSPEQAEMSGLDVDTRTDVYSLGVILYELLTGALPFDSATLRAGSAAEIQRIIRETEPARPSTRLSSVEDATHILEKQLGDSPRTVARRLRGDLDWIVLMAMEKDRTRRYPTAASLADDLKRFLAHEPVLAGPPSTAYRLRKFARRNRPFIVAAAVITLVVIAGLVATSIGFVQASHERDAARTARDESEAVVRFLTDTLAAVDPADQGKDVTVRAVLDKAAGRIDTDFADQPVIQARLNHTIGRTLRELGQYDDAAPHLRRALALANDHLSPDDPLTIAAMYDLGWLYWDIAQYDKAEPLYTEALARRRKAFGNDDPETLTAISGLALLYKSQEQYDKAEPLYLEALERSTRTLGEDNKRTLITMTNLATLYTAQDRLDEAEPLLTKALQHQRKTLGITHPDTITSMNNLAFLYAAQGRHEKAEPLYAEVVAAIRMAMPAGHWWLGAALANQARSLTALERYPEAESALLEAHQIVSAALGPDHPRTQKVAAYLADLYDAWNKPALAAKWRQPAQAEAENESR